MNRWISGLMCLAVSACAAQPLDTKAFESPQFIAAEATPTPAQMPEVQAYQLPITARCRDNWYSYSDQLSGTCSGHGGVRAWVNRPEH